MNQQDSLFASGSTSNTCERIELPQADLLFFPHFLSPRESADYQATLRTTMQWEQSTINLYGKSLKIPRLNAWYGDEDSHYHYSGKHFIPHRWTPELLEIKQAVEHVAEHAFNSVLLNCYRDGQDSVAWHSDDEQELGQNPVIASLSLGGERLFYLRHKTNKALPVTKIALTAGSLLIMRSTTQHYWQHQIPKTKKACHERLNLTFRQVFS